jgi:hypothetical protein
MITLTAIVLALMLGLAATKAWNWAAATLARKGPSIEAGALRQAASGR